MREIKEIGVDRRPMAVVRRERGEEREGERKGRKEKRKKREKTLALEEKETAAGIERERSGGRGGESERRERI